MPIRRRTQTKRRTTRRTRGKYNITVCNKGSDGKYRKFHKFTSDRRYGDDNYPDGTKVYTKWHEPYDETSNPNSKYHVFVYKKGANKRYHKYKDFWADTKPPASILGPNDRMEIREYKYN